ncbi:solute carrier organic anion transporter family member 5A1b [Lycodopsis pacificus]
MNCILGCLFENELCSPYEICVNASLQDLNHRQKASSVNAVVFGLLWAALCSSTFQRARLLLEWADGMFGRCHPVPVKEVYTYDVSPSVVQRFRTLLEKLSNKGLTWRDDATQQVLSKELSKLRRVPYRPQQNTDRRPVSEAMDPAEQRVKPAEAELSRSLQTYLQRLGLLPKTSSASSLSTQVKGERFQSGTPADFYRSEAQIVPQKSSPSGFSSLPSFLPLQEQRPPDEQLLATQAEGDLLLGALRRYLSLYGGRVSPEEQEAPSTRLRPFYSRADNPGPKKDASKSRLVKLGRTQGASVKDPLTSVDERFIENVLKSVGRHHVDVDGLTAQDLGQLSSLIADALQVVDQDQGLNRGMTRVRPGPRDLEGEEEEEEDTARDEEEEKLLENAPTLKPQEIPRLAPAALQERHTNTEERNIKDSPESGILFSKLLAYLDESSFSGPPSARGRDVVAVETPRGRQAGLENVQSRTSTAAVTVQKKDAAQSVEEVSEVRGWIKEVAPPPASLVYEKPREKTMHVAELQLDVKAGGKKADEDVFGYVITDTDVLQTDEGLHLMEILARRAKIQMTDFAELS